MSGTVRTAPELLAPAGSPDALKAAVANGADAVYLGVDAFNARRNAENFALDTLPEACRFAHLSGVRVYLTMNVLILPHEMDEALTTIDRAWAAGVDGVIIQDLGLLETVAATMPHVRIHASTQMGAHDSETIRAIAAAGASRVTLAREMSLEEIETVSRLDVEIESFAHGALCMSYSGQCLMSSLIGRRSANRGMCAQPCRLPWELVDRKDVAMNVPGEHLLSPKDLSSIDLLPRLVATGVSAIKIEGRMKSPEYVAVVVAAYRAALDRAVDEPDSYAVADDEQQALSEAFSRGFSPAYLVGERGNDMMGYTRPNNRGVQVARVASLKQGVVTLAVEKDLSSDDTVEFWTGRGRFAQKVGALWMGDSRVEAAPAGSKVRIEVEKPISPGDRVFRVRNSELSARAEATWRGSHGRVRPLEATVEMRIGERLRITLVDEAGVSGTAFGPVVEAARTKPVVTDDVIEHVGRLGGTPYVVSRWDVVMDEGVGIGYSTLHKVRREAVEELEAAVLAPWDARREVHVAPVARERTARVAAAISISMLVDSIEAARRCIAAGADEVAAPIDVLQTEDDLGLPIVPVLPRICHDREFRRAMSFVREGRPVFVSTLGQLDAAVAAGATVTADWPLNLTNPETAAALARRGAVRAWLSPELSGRQIAEVCASSDLPLGLTVSGIQEVMVTEHCVLMSLGPCDRACARCDRRDRQYSLRDRKSYRFPVKTDLTGRTHVFNSVPLDLASALPEVVAAGVSSIRIDATMLKPHQAVEALERFRVAVTAAQSGVEPRLRDLEGPVTAGHFYRGVS